MSRIVVKVGSNVLTRADGMPNVTNMSALVDQIARLRQLGHEVVLVSSGAVACGRGAVAPRRQLDAVASRQLFSSIGQIKLINLYNQLFGAYGLVVGQVLTQKENFASRTSYLNQRACMLTMLDNGVIPVVNENDTASLTELMFTDNDELSGLIATMTDADTLIILSNVDRLPLRPLVASYRTRGAGQGCQQPCRGRQEWFRTRRDGHQVRHSVEGGV